MSSCCPPSSDPPIEQPHDSVTTPSGSEMTQMLRSAGFAAIRIGQPATIEYLSRSTGLTTRQIRDALSEMAVRGSADVDDDGNVVAIGGLSLIPTRHELLLDGVALYTWCAYDALGIPPAAGAGAEARSRCAQCGQPIQVTFVSGQLDDSPAAALWFPHCASPLNARQDFCTVANLFCTRDHLNAWRDAAHNPPGEILTIAQATDRGRVHWTTDAQWPSPA